MATLARKGMMFVLSSPSGGGKTTLARLLLQNDADISLSVSCTTRPPRAGEEHGKDYFFLDAESFAKKRASDYFYETAQVFGNWYGTPKGAVQEKLASGQDVLFDVDWQGTRSLAAKARESVVSVFILPPNLAELRRRLTVRAQDAADVIDLRMRRAEEEIAHWSDYDYVLINDSIDLCLQNILYIVKAERVKRQDSSAVERFVNGLLGEDRQNSVARRSIGPK
ncbi:MAG: guanylate kinase [Rickettsiales bacterium]